MLFNNKLFNSIACLLSFTNLQLVIPGRTWILLYLGRTVYKRLWACLALYLYRVVTNFRVLNERLVRVNHAFPIVHDCLEAIGASKCEVMSILDLRDAYHTLPLAEE